MEGDIHTSLLYLDPIEGTLIEEQIPPLNLDSFFNGWTVESLFSSTDQIDSASNQQDHEKISLKKICEQVAETVKEPHIVENLINALVDPNLAFQIYGVDQEVDHVDHVEFKKVLDEEHITEGLELFDKVEDLHSKFALATRKTQLLEFNVWDLTEKIKLLESKVSLQEQQIVDVQNRQEEQDALLLSPLQNIYLRHFHDQVREGISDKLSATPLHARHQRTLRALVRDNENGHCNGREHVFNNNLWRFMQKTHNASPQLFNKASMWNQFVDELLTNTELVALLDISCESILLTRFGRLDPIGEQSEQHCEESASLQNKHVFAELVTRQDAQHRALYTQLYKFMFHVAPDTMNFKVCSSFPLASLPLHALCFFTIA